MELLPQNMSVDYIGKRKYFFTGSAIAMLAILVGIALFGFNWGVDFAGGSELEIQFAGPVDPADVRRTIEGAGFPDASVQVIGAPEEHSFLVRVGRISLMTPEDASRAEAALRQRFGDNLATFDFNPEFGDKVELRFKQPVPGEQVREALASANVGVRELREVPNGYTVITRGIADNVTDALAAAEAKGMPKAELRRLEFVGPQVGKDLRNRGILSLLYAAIGIVIYIAFRFDAKFAPGAIAAMVHDVMIVLAYYLVTQREFNLISVTVLLTIIGYSVNDTIVIYDRIRENLEKRKGMNLASLINLSVNETMSRTLLTTFVTALSLIGLLVFSVGSLWDFAAAMMVGLVSGTYSTIFIASPMTIWIEDLMAKKGSARPAAA